MSNRTSFKPNRKFPTPPTVIDDVRNHTLVLQALVEALNTGARHTKNTLDSFVRVRELVDMGLIELQGDTFKVAGSAFQSSTPAPSTPTVSFDTILTASGEVLSDANGNVLSE